MTETKSWKEWMRMQDKDQKIKITIDLDIDIAGTKYVEVVELLKAFIEEVESEREEIDTVNL